MAKQTKLILGGVLFVFLFLNIATGMLSSFKQLRDWSSCGLDTINKANGWLITDITQDGQSPILHVDDEVLGVKGLPLNFMVKNLSNLPIPAGSELMLMVRCQGVIHQVPVKTYGASLKDWLKEIGIFLMIGSFLITGLLILLVKADDPQAWLLSLMLGTFSGLLNFQLTNVPLLLFWTALLTRVFSFLFLPLFVHFFSVFPRPSPLLKRWTGFLYFVYGSFILIILPYFLLQRMGSQGVIGFEKNEWLVLFRRMSYSAANGLLIVFLATGIVALLMNYRSSESDDRRKLHLVVVGCSAGFFNLLIIVLSEFLGFNKSHPQIHEWIFFLMTFTLPLIPISFAYAIIKHQVIPISLIIRRGMRYVLVSHGSYLLEIGVFFFAITTFLTFFFRWLFSTFQPRSMETLGITIGTISAIVGIIFWNLTRSFHTKFLAPIIDRKFFRQSYDSQQIISELVESLRTTTEQKNLLAQIATKIRSALQTESVAILLRGAASKDYTSAYYCEYNPVDGGNIHCESNFSLPVKSTIVSHLHNSREPVNIDEISLPDDEIALLQQIKSELLLPLSSQTELLGIVSLGSRLGDLPFSTEDKELLMSVAGPGTFALENALLLERMIEEARRREEIETENEARAKELEEARQIQLSMLPRKVPFLPNLDIAAYMKTATEVGGDYYDFHLGSGGTLTIAVGDATGHGLKAGTIVTATKSLFNNLAGLNDIPEIFRQSSNALKLMNLRALYMAMTMAKLNGYELTVSLAGMPAVLIYRAETNTVEEIALRGMPLGSIKNYVYKQQTTTLKIGDIVVLLSDGFPERFNPSGEILGFEKAGEILAHSGSLSAQQLINKFIQIGDEWGDTKPQDDDVTFVVLKIIKPNIS